ncbi:Putative mannan endo-1,4-beta-mannosidase C [Tolypocladium paradoxum]|uniref:mannan endo-1,4-beta-mannosidase n=1 Tax=Tolypocladium paradoxum TaxID=94208 RepID=A0A2S4KNN9_9HYPO|nr:Putative mannan endo-1,4-beta-mannosidase C [Tolypocladium paradoxum]
MELTFSLLDWLAAPYPHVTKQVPKSFVTFKGKRFQLNGKDFYFAGSNAYYLLSRGLWLRAAKRAGLNVFRSWPSATGIHHRFKWSSQIWGRGRRRDRRLLPGMGDRYMRDWRYTFDKVVDATSKVSMKLTVTLTNNWAEYGGVDVYTVTLGGKYHVDLRSAICLYSTNSSAANLSYRLPKIKTAFKSYMKESMMTCDRTSSTIMAWELAMNLDAAPNRLATSRVVATAARSFHMKMSACIKGLEPHRLVTWGGEGGFNRESDAWAYNGSGFMMPHIYWQFGQSGYSYRQNHDDGFTIYLDDAEAKPRVYQQLRE